MNRINALWIDRRLRRSPAWPPPELGAACQLSVVTNADDLPALIHQMRPRCIVFDFDYPNAEGLKALLRTRQQFAFVPVLMLIEPCYDSLLLWALRARVWDVLIKPVAVTSLLQRMLWLRDASSETDADGTRTNAMPVPAVPVEARFCADSASANHRTDSVCSYVKGHLHEKLSETELASRHGMSRTQFSRAFHREHGVTFREYLQSARLHRALEMLGRTDAPITEVAFCAGFHDLSHFASVIRRHAGCSPSEFRHRVRESHQAIHSRGDGDDPDALARGSAARAQAPPTTLHKNRINPHKSPSDERPRSLQ